jgi:tRNA-5-methyluridine54 2-sulfurtransferase
VKCTRCRAAAVIEIRRHNAAYCGDCFVTVFRNQIARSIDQWSMFTPNDRVVVAVSGGKDSLALWDVLLEAGYDATGLYLGLGIGGYSERSHRATRAFAADRGASLITLDLAEVYGFDIPTAGRKGSRSTCAVCGLSKRYAFNKAALDGGFDVIATGHNLDDEAATLLGNTLRWNTEYIARQAPVLPADDGLVKKVKPLHRISELETAAYAFLRGIDYIVEECPFARGATSITHKELLNRLEDTSPGSKAMFLQGFLDKARGRFQEREAITLVECVRCGQTTTGEVCAFCKLRDQVTRGVRPADRTSAPEFPDLQDPPAARGLISDLHAASEIHAS